MIFTRRLIEHSPFVIGKIHKIETKVSGIQCPIFPYSKVYITPEQKCMAVSQPTSSTPTQFPPTYNLLCFATIFCPFAIHATASVTISSTISLADFFSFTTAAALPIKNGRALSMVSSSISSPSFSKSCSTGMVPLEVRSLISWARFSSQSLM